VAYVEVILYRDVSPLVQKRGWRRHECREESDRAIVAEHAEHEKKTRREERRGEERRGEERRKGLRGEGESHMRLRSASTRCLGNTW